MKKNYRAFTKFNGTSARFRQPYRPFNHDLSPFTAED